MTLPKFKNQLEYDQAQVLMQPTLIRVLDNIRKESESSSWTVRYEDIETPFPGYIAYLQKDNYQKEKNIWQLCFEICFVDYNEDPDKEIETDHSLFDEDGELDWQKLEIKTQKFVKNLFIEE